MGIGLRIGYFVLGFFLGAFLGVAIEGAIDGSYWFRYLYFRLEEARNERVEKRRKGFLRKIRDKIIGLIRRKPRYKGDDIEC